MIDRLEAPLLFAVLEYGEFPEMLRVAEALHQRLRREVVFWFVKASYRRLSQDSAAVIAQGFTWLDASGRWSDQVASGFAPQESASAEPSLREPLPKLPWAASRRGRLGRWLAFAGLPVFVLQGVLRDTGFVLRHTARDLANFVRDVRRFRARYRAIESVLASLQPALIVVGQDTVGTDLSFLLIAAGRRRIPRLMTPFAMFSLRETADYAHSKVSHRVNFSAINALVAKIYPHWALKWHDEFLLRLPGSRALALEYTGLIEGLPWTPLSAPVEALTAESEVLAETLIEMGIDRNCISVVGSPIHDQLTNYLSNREVVRKRLCKDQGYDSSRPMVVCGWPANLFPWLGGRPIAYSSYEQLAEVWVRVLADIRDQCGVNVFVTVHPKTLPHEYKIAQDYGFPCRIGDAGELIAACDIFTTLNGSSITSWAYACSIPVILFDCFFTQYKEFNQEPGCIQVLDQEAFISQLYKLCTDYDARSELAVRQREVSERWGILDGSASVRLAEVGARLIRDVSV